MFCLDYIVSLVTHYILVQTTNEFISFEHPFWNFSFALISGGISAKAIQQVDVVREIILNEKNVFHFGTIPHNVTLPPPPMVCLIA